MHFLREMIALRASGHAGIYSACTASRPVLEAVMDAALETGGCALVEATANQVNQFGGYTGMTPADFAEFVGGIADAAGMPRNRVILGGDHLGPLVWQNEPEASAMEKAGELIRQFVCAGYTKIHLDASMRLADDPTDARLPDEVIARRCARMADAAEQAFAELRKSNPDAEHPVYVVGSEVPIPGGAQVEESLHVTRPEDFHKSMEAFRDAMSCVKGEPFTHIIAAVVQPGVEFGDESIEYYDSAKAKELTDTLSGYDGLVFEGHSTDYQPPALLRKMVEDGVAILKVGPALTFYLREGYFALELMEKELIGDKSKRSGFAETLDRVMQVRPKNWQKHYRGNEKELAFKRKFSFSDRCRYYLPEPEVAAAVERLIHNLRGVQIPLSLISQYMPMQFEAVRSGRLAVDPGALLKARVRDCINDYLFAVERRK